MPFTARRLLLIGGGRWGRVHADILRRVLPADGVLTWVSGHNGKALAQLTSAWGGTSPRFCILRETEEALAMPQDAAVIVSAPHMHATHVRTVLQANVPVLVEKPFVMQSEEVAELVALAEQRDLLLGVALHLLFTSYLRKFQVMMANRLVRTALIEWCDLESETRYGELKRLNISVQKIHDAFSHVWSTIRVLFPSRQMVVSGVSVGAGASTEIGLDVSGVEIIVRMDRRARRRCRRVKVLFADGGSAQLDFANEPGVISIDGTICSADADWDTRPSPLTLQTVSFLSALDSPADAASWPGRAQFVASGVSLAEDIAERVSEAEAAILVEAWVHDNLADADARAIISDNIGPELVEQGVLGPEADLEIDTIFSAFLQREPSLISGSGQSLRPQSSFLKRLKVALT